MTWLDNFYEQHRSSNMRVRSLKVGERDLWCVKGAKDGYHMIQSLTAYLFFINCKIILWQKEPKVILKSHAYWSKTKPEIYNSDVLLPVFVSEMFLLITSTHYVAGI